MKRWLPILIAACGSTVDAQQLADREYRPPVDDPAYATGAGPHVCIDEAHFNFHTMDGRFRAFAELLRRDGYRPRALKSELSAQSLADCKIVVIANAQPNDEEWDTYPTPTPSAFKDKEIEAIRSWVQDGGALLLIADHMPLAGAAASLAKAFDVEFMDGFAVEAFGAESERRAAFSKPTIFRSSDGTLADHAVVRGRSEKESVTSVRSFTGQAFRSPRLKPLLVLPSNFVLLMPEKAWQFREDTPRKPVGGWLQGAVMTYGKGRAAFFGEAAMFTAQVAGPNRRPMGMNAPGAEQNFQFVLNLVHWLSQDL
jgi:hypothetical protein